jgi:serine/threonine-protein kinase RsbW
VNGSRVVRLRIPAKAEYITLCRLALAGISQLRPLDEETLADLKLALTEACTNSVRHAYDNGAGDVEIVYELGADRIAIEVTDEGEGFMLDEELEADRMSESGLGIAIIRALADELEIERRADGKGSRLRFVKLLGAAA